MKHSYTLPAAADFHVHLRDGAMAEAVAPTCKAGGVDVVYVMPNLVPPVTTVAAALEYKQRLLKIDSSITYLMTLYLHESITPDVVREAKKAGIAGIKVKIRTFSIIYRSDYRLTICDSPTQQVLPPTPPLGSSLTSPSSLYSRLWKKRRWSSTCTVKYPVMAKTSLL